jgi:inhibitor of KinA
MKTSPSPQPARSQRKPDDFCIRSVGDSALTIEFEPRIDPIVNARVIAVATLIDTLRLKGILDVVPTYRSVTVYYNPFVLSDSSLKARLAELAAHRPQPSPTRKRIVEIPVCYDDEFGLDLRSVSAVSGLAPTRLIELHTFCVYRVYMLGFLPGFPYMGKVPAEIAVPRLATPRTSVPAGSVGIADSQTGIYPVESPGGWRLIGRTPVRIYNPDRRRPFLLTAGDRVRFRPIDRDEFDKLSRIRSDRRK